MVGGGSQDGLRVPSVAPDLQGARSGDAGCAPGAGVGGPSAPGDAPLAAAGAREAAPAPPPTDLWERVPDGAFRLGGVLFFAGAIGHKFWVRHTYASPLLWALETGLFAVLLACYLLRTRPRSRARGVGEVVVPLLGGVWPMLLLFEPRSAFGLRHQPAILGVLSLGTGLALWGYLALNRSFSIMVEARELKRSGPYRWIRHPVYAGQLVCAVAVTAWRTSATNLLLLLGFAVIQGYRARLEERKLEAAFPEYASYRAETGMFWPRFGSGPPDGTLPS